ncbi:MAG TPA: phosphopantetheine-binding protein [Gammaproteobacteria bacterium]|nr:phosphopantetheine-binding protein [Gammaproteobacteria bacterium]
MNAEAAASGLIEELKALIIRTLDLEDVTPADIDAEAPLFGEGGGLGLDSIDALELGVALQKHYHIPIEEEAGSYRDHFGSVAALARFVQSRSGRP